MLAVTLGAEVAVTVQLLILRHEIWKAFLKKGEEDGSRTRLQEQWVREDAHSVRLCRCLDEGFEIFRFIGDPGKYRSADHAR